MNPHFYLIPGLGFDHRIFEKLELPNYTLKYLNWIEPKPNETIQHYATRMAEKIDHDRGEIILIGHSLGGVVSQEIACIIDVKKIFLISSIQSREELPLQFKIIHRFNLQKLFNKNFIIKSHDYWAANYGYKTQEEQDLFKDMIGKQTNTYLQWALKALSVWQTPNVPSCTQIIQIHGDQDKTFPVALMKKTNRVVKGAGHFMIYQEAKLLSDFIEKNT